MNEKIAVVAVLVIGFLVLSSLGWILAVLWLGRLVWFCAKHIFQVMVALALINAITPSNLEYEINTRFEQQPIMKDLIVPATCHVIMLPVFILGWKMGRIVWYGATRIFLALVTLAIVLTVLEHFEINSCYSLDCVGAF